jgi:protein SCO1
MKRRARGILPAILLCAAAVCGVGQAGDPPTDSLYQLQVSLTTQKAETAGFDLYRGHPTMISMFYGSCPAACPMLITAIQLYEAHLTESSQAQLRIPLISFDAAHDTPAQLDRLAHLHRTNPARWAFTSAADADARRIAALLGIRYRRLADGEFDHSLLITLLDGQGRVLARTTKLIGDQEFEVRLRKATAPSTPDITSSPDTGERPARR